MNERCKFVLEWERRWEAAQGGRVNVSELCRQFGVSRQTGYQWLWRYRAQGHDLGAMEERSRRPLNHPRAVPAMMQDLVVEARKLQPNWGPRTLRRWLVDRRPGQPIPSHSCISAILKRRGMIKPRGKRRRGKPIAVASPFPECTEPNHTWCIDFKGWFRMLDGIKCYPLTLIDAFSRFLLRCEPLTEPAGDQVQRILDSAFHEFGLPTSIRSDGGPPFASTGPACLSRLTVWLLKLGITVEIIAPAKPQQNGRLERFHRTLKLEVPPASHLREQRRACDTFRGVYKFERPHHALELNTPGSVYSTSRRRYPRKLLGIPRSEAIPGHLELVDSHGFIRWHRHRFLVGQALSHELVMLLPGDRSRWEILFGPILLGWLDPADPRHRIIPLRRPKGPIRLSLLDNS